MAKWHGNIGYVETLETSPGVWTEQVTVRQHFGDVTKNTSRYQSTGQLNDDLTINNQFSILADPYASQNFHSMRYVEFMGTKWKITNVDVLYPRLLLTVGGIYNG